MTIEIAFESLTQSWEASIIDGTEFEAGASSTTTVTYYYLGAL